MTRDALVVGINQYPLLKDTSTSKAKHLKTPATDAEAIAQLLEIDGNFRVQRLPRSNIDGRLQVDPEKSVTADELLDEITKLFLTKDRRDTALLFFAGHGLQKPLGSLKQILIATSDANPVNKKWNGILLRDLWEIVEQSQVKEQIIWLDSCYSGELLELKDSDFPGRRRLIIAASHSSEVAYGRLDGKHGLLSGALIKGLNPDKVPQGDWITDRTLAHDVEEELNKYYAEKKIPQIPQIRRPDQPIKLIQGKGQVSLNKLPDVKKSAERKIPFVLPQLDISTFTGRNEELKKLEESLLDNQGVKLCSIAGLTGVGGIGKSALACHFATLHKADFPDGVIGLRVDGKNVNTIARQFARLCGAEIKLDADEEEALDATTIMQHVFAHRRMLLIFDDADDSIRQLLPGGNRCAVIVTTRDRGSAISLEIPKEGRINLSPLPEADALLLLEKLIGKERVAAEPEAARELIELVGYLPIAIKIIGSLLSLYEKRSLTRHAKRLTKKRQLARIKFGDVKHLDLFACFSLSLEYLQPDEINFFACLSVCAKNGFSLQTAIVTTACDDDTTEERLNKLDRLSLINNSEVGEDRFVFHPLIYEFAVEKAIELGLHEEATARHAEYFIKLVKREINPVVAKEIAAEFDEIILAAQWLQQQTTIKYQEQDKYEFAVYLQPFFEQYADWEQAVHFMLGFEKLAESNENWEKVVKFRIQQAKYLSLQGNRTGAEELLKSELISEILSKIEEETTRQLSLAKYLNTLGGIVMRQGKFDEAVKVFKRAVEIEEQLNNQEGLAMVLNSLGGVLRRQGGFNEAEEILNRSYAISMQLNDKRHAAMVLHNLGICFQEQERLDEAFYTLQRSSAIFEELGHQRSLLMVLTSLGRVLQRQGKLDEAITAIEKSAAIEEKLADKRNFIIKLNLLGSLYQEQARFNEAIQTYERALAIAQETDNKQQLAITLTQLGGLYQEQRQFDEAIQSCERAIAITLEADNKQQLAIILTQLGGLYQKQGRIDEAIQSCERAIAIAQETDNKQQLAITLHQLGGLYQKQEQIDRAIQSFEGVIAITEETDNKQQLATTLTQLGGLYQQQGRIDKAIQSFKRAIAIAQDADNKQQLAITLTQLGGLYQEQRQFDKAIQSFESALAIEQEIDDKHSLTITLKQLGGLYQKQGQIDRAIQSLERIVTIAEGTDNKQQLKIILDNSLDYTIFLCQVDILYGSAARATQKFHAPEMILRRYYELSVKLDDKQWQAIILNSLGQVFCKQGGEKKFQLALMYFRESIKCAEQLDNQKHLAKVHTDMGQALLAHGHTKQASEAFRIGFEINESLRNSLGLVKITPELTYALVQLGNREEAISYCQRALAIYPQDQVVVELYDKLSSSKEIVNSNTLKLGTVKFIKKNKQGKVYGYIAADDGSDDIYFQEDFINSDFIFQLQKGSRVKVEVKQKEKRVYAKSLRILTNDEST
ncbi:tetratricopeptide repeat protein [Scytonema sp. UIC 10036]|uniref:tetratricopeptide repeat protein n=1 Tax=Scytonema sp. UIC 10036 TaxID=2304196 RepID=UPI0012DA6990|nr:tetratricopeptide repeat protein [Scytonema sp. UIC 10036]MUG93166.1 tetratricopeptide repeat protein [Scytonema sp. UIC 10036]